MNEPGKIPCGIKPWNDSTWLEISGGLARVLGMSRGRPTLNEIF
jgi:hypothetical protein